MFIALNLHLQSFFLHDVFLLPLQQWLYVEAGTDELTVEMSVEIVVSCVRVN
jgi:hypothetical protein